MKTIGIIGGMSWESTVTYYEIINQEVIRRLGGFHSAKILMYSVDFAELEENMENGYWQGNAVILADAAMRLEKAGADFIVIAFKERMHGNLPTPVEHMLENKHGMFDTEQADFKYDGVNGDAASLCRLLEEEIAV
ncbi:MULTISPECIES: aspartate/glutamate racemase family protein [unclassified Butyrivibrio]|uniref:aspartate/glutamate racemase family protein n=1 Tax=unclassified Butyrivibrio TaxID=2639466 RepID=UPI00041E6C1A|nr:MULTISPECIES: aspartate/glutamate racemase family protein [unclassified Butyrivibrio]